MKSYDIVIIGGGPAVLPLQFPQKKNRESGSILILERDGSMRNLKPVLHNGFGLHTFKEELTGPEYADGLLNRQKN